MDERIKCFVGLDVHKDSITIAVAEAGRAPARLIGGIARDIGKLRAGLPVDLHRLPAARRIGAPDPLRIGHARNASCLAAHWRGYVLVH